MKNRIYLMAALGLVLGLFTASQYAFSQQALASGSDCIATIRSALALEVNDQWLNITGGKTKEGLSCELKIRYFESNSGITKKNYRGLDFIPLHITRYADGKASDLYPAMMTRLEDNTNGLDRYTISKCAVTPTGIKLSYHQQQLFGWRKSFDYRYAFTLKEGKIVGAEMIEEDGAQYNCRF